MMRKQVKTGKEIALFPGICESLAFSPDGKTLISTGQHGTILVWDWEEALKYGEP